jgi:hypothetical protein
MQTVTTCRCNLCSGEIEFESNRAGETITCPWCALDTKLYIPGGLPSPPRLPAPAPQRSTNHISTVLAAIAIILLVLFGIGIAASQAPSETSDTTADYTGPKIDADVLVNTLTLSVQNKNTFKWKDVTLYINGRDSGYKATHYGVSPGQTFEIPLLSFVNADGERFQGVRYQPKNVTLEVPNCRSATYRFQ